MNILSDYIPFVNEQINIQEKLSKKFDGQTWRQNLHISSAERFKALAKDIEASMRYIRELEKPVSEKISLKQQLTLSFDEVQGLPDELVQELSISDADKIEFTIQGIISEAGGIISLDRLLFSIYKKTGEIYKRTQLTSRLYRMANKGLIFSVPNKKGVYSTHELSVDEVNKILNFENENKEVA